MLLYIVRMYLPGIYIYIFFSRCSSCSIFASCYREGEEETIFFFFFFTKLDHTFDCHVLRLTDRFNVTLTFNVEAVVAKYKHDDIVPGDHRILIKAEPLS